MPSDNEIRRHLRSCFREVYPYMNDCAITMPDADTIRVRCYASDMTDRVYEATIDFDDETHYTFILADTLIELRIPFCA